jgi:hypothetical protein
LPPRKKLTDSCLLKKSKKINIYIYTNEFWQDLHLHFCKYLAMTS